MINVCEKPQQHALIFQWVRDGSVHDVLASGHRFSELDKLNILRQAASGVNAYILKNCHQTNLFKKIFMKQPIL